jgi:GDP/UDP-N,N'-diacetylbacillosamine 2-epimerase (hydrolysing)
MNNVAILTSSRADFGIYLPLLRALKNDKSFKISIIAFGTHLSTFHGYTINNIIQAGFDVDYTVESMMLGDSPDANSTATGINIIKFSSFWKEHNEDFHLVFCLGDRFEMFGAVMAGVPFGIKFAHIHGGETTLGAVDNIYRHSISLASLVHFTANEEFSVRVKQLINSNNYVFTVGSLSLENVLSTQLYSNEEFYKMWGIDLAVKTILVTYHPETIEYKKVEEYFNIIVTSLLKLSEKYQILLTMPNADTSSGIIRFAINSNFKGRTNFYIYENLGSKSYYTALSKCLFVFGNSSSGIIEAASFGKFVINVGDRQKGRLKSDNVFDVPYSEYEINSAIETIRMNSFNFNGTNVYYKKNSSASIINLIKPLLDESI